MAYNIISLSQEALLSEEQCVGWLQEHGLISKNPLCEVCGKFMKTCIRGRNNVRFRCSRKIIDGEEHVMDVSALKGTFFENSRFGIRNIVALIYFFSKNQTSYNFLMEECSIGGGLVSSTTICDWVSFCREVCFEWIDKTFEREGKLGGEGVVVEIDECKIGKRKYNKGRIVEGTWVLGMIEISPEGHRRGGKYRLEICPNNSRDAATLIPLIVKHVKEGTIIVTDLWQSYFQLPEHNYTHFTVNHSTNFIDPLTGANTQTIESSWRDVKRTLKTGIQKGLLADHLCEYLYRREVRLRNEDKFLHFIQCIREIYPGE